MADIYEKTLNTRIKLKYDTYENWIASSKGESPLILKKGEAAICELENNTGSIQNAPTILVKYGDGERTFEALPWSSALAADVYAWAKASGLAVEVHSVDETVKHSSDDTTIQVLTVVGWSKTDSHPNGALVFNADNAATLESIEKHSSYTISAKPHEGNDELQYKDCGVDIVLSNELDNNSRIHVTGGENSGISTSYFNGKDQNGIEFSRLVITDTKDIQLSYEQNDVDGVDINLSDGLGTTGNKGTVHIGSGNNVSVSKATNGGIIISANDSKTLIGKDTNENILTIDSTTNSGNGITTYNYTLGIDKTALENLIGERTTAAMEFKGATATVPTGSIVNGDMWKVTGAIVISATDDAQGVGFTTKVGDAIVAKVEGNTAKWFLIPSGDDVEDTWRPVYVNGVQLPNEKELSFCNDHGNVQFSFCHDDDKKICANVTIPDLKVAEDGSHSGTVTDGLTTVVSEMKEADGTEHKIAYKTVTNVATSTYVTNEIKKLDSSVDTLSIPTQEDQFTVTKKDSSETKTVSPKAFAMGVTQEDGKLTSMTGSVITTDDIIQGEFTLIFDCGGASY